MENANANANANAMAFEACIDDLATAIHADLQLQLQRGAIPYWFQSKSQFLKTAIWILRQHTLHPLTLWDQEDVEEAIRDAERRIYFAITGRSHTSEWLYGFIRYHIRASFFIKDLVYLFKCDAALLEKEHKPYAC